VTVPRSIRDLLGLKPGDAVDFFVAGDGAVYLRAAQYDVRDLRGLLTRTGQTPVTVGMMDDALRSRRN
jgi:AbrB family looped-hinge helix DNA binding protein